MDYLNYTNQVQKQSQKPQPQGFVDIQQQNKPQPQGFGQQKVQLTQDDFKFGDLTQTQKQEQSLSSPTPPQTSDQLVQLFPTAVVISKYPNDYRNELEFVKNLECNKKNGEGIDGNPIEENGEYFNRQSVNTYILDLPELTNIRNFVKFKVNEYARNIMGSTDELVITQSWLNKNGQGEHHHDHTHPNSIISGVWYPQITKQLPPIQFRTNTPNQIALHVDKFNAFNSATFMLPMEAGELIVFPSTLSHSVPPNKSKEERISLSFNTWAKGNLGGERALTYLPLERCV